MKKTILFLLSLFVCAATSAEQLPSPEFSVSHGLCDKAFSLKLTCDYPYYRILYTTDGSTPSAGHGTLYTRPLNITTTTCVRAVALPILDADTASVSVTSTYIFLDDVLRQSNTPSGYPSRWGKYYETSGTAIADYEMDPEIVNQEGMAEKIKDGFRSLPIISIVTDVANLFSDKKDEETGGIYMFTGAYGSTGNGWLRAASFEVFADESCPNYDGSDIQVNCAIKIHGNASRQPEKTPKHSIRVQFKSAYGVSKLKFPMFQDDLPMRNGEIKKNADKYNQLVLRAGFGNTWLHWDTGQQKQAMYTRDAWAKRMMTHMGYVAPRTTFMHLFINGLYWGLYNPTERPDDDFCALRLGGDKENYDVLRNDEGQKLEIQYGSDEAYRQMFSLAKSTGYADYQKLQGLNTDGSRNESYPVLLDVNNFIDYMLVNQYGGNGDWDHHNWVAVRRNDKEDMGFQWIPWDSELVMQNINDNKMSLNNNLCPSNLFQLLMNNSARFRQTYFDRLQYRCIDKYGAFSPDSVAETFSRLARTIDKAMYCESARWGDYRRDVHPYTSRGKLYTKEEYFDRQNEYMLSEYFPKRTGIFVSQVQNTSWWNGIEAPEIYIDGVLMENYTDTIDADSKISIKGTGLKFYTTDGGDPMKWTSRGAPMRNTAATAYSRAFSLTEDCILHARCLVSSSSEFSPLTERRFVIRGMADIIDHPRLGTDSQSFQAFDLSGRRLSVSSVEELPEGIFILKENGKTRKIRKRK